MLPSVRQREHKRKVIGKNQTDEHMDFDEYVLKEDMKLQTSTKELVKVLAYEGLRVNQVS